MRYRRAGANRAGSTDAGPSRSGGNHSAPTRRSASWPRSLTGLLAGGLVALALALVVAWFVADRIGSAGPGPGTLVWHGVAAVAAVIAQVQADRRTGLLGVLAMAAVVAITAVVLAAQWLA